jgi:hypothetical protein
VGCGAAGTLDGSAALGLDIVDCGSAGTLDGPVALVVCGPPAGAVNDCSGVSADGGSNATSSKVQDAQRGLTAVRSSEGIKMSGFKV